MSRGGYKAAQVSRPISAPDASSTLVSYHEASHESNDMSAHLRGQILELEDALEALERRRYPQAADLRLKATYRRLIRQHRAALAALQPDGGSASAALRAAIRDSKSATLSLVEFLENASPSKTGPSGIGKDNYTWYQQNVHLVPLTWEDEVRLLKRELDRAWSSLKLEEQRNRDLPPLIAASNSEEYEAKAEEAVDRIMAFFEEKEILTITPYMKPAIAALSVAPL